MALASRAPWLLRGRGEHNIAPSGVQRGRAERCPLGGSGGAAPRIYAPSLREGVRGWGSFAEAILR